jgi:hypothetical protein
MASRPNEGTNERTRENKTHCCSSVLRHTQDTLFDLFAFPYGRSLFVSGGSTCSSGTPLFGRLFFLYKFLWGEMKRHRIRLSQLLSSILLWTRENLFDDDKSILIFLGFVFSRRKWGLPVFRKSSQGKLDPVASSGSHTITTLPVTSSGSNNNSGGSNNRLPAPFRKSQSDKKFKVKTTTKKNKTKSKSQS